MEITVQKVLMFLEEAGWTELVDSRWERQLINDITGVFPNIDEKILEEVLEIVLV